MYAGRSSGKGLPAARGSPSQAGTLANDGSSVTLSRHGGTRVTINPGQLVLQPPSPAPGRGLTSTSPLASIMPFSPSGYHSRSELPRHHRDGDEGPMPASSPAGAGHRDGSDGPSHPSRHGLGSSHAQAGNGRGSSAPYRQYFNPAAGLHRYQAGALAAEGRAYQQHLASHGQSRLSLASNTTSDGATSAGASVTSSSPHAVDEYPLGLEVDDLGGVSGGSHRASVPDSESSHRDHYGGVNPGPGPSRAGPGAPGSRTDFVVVGHPSHDDRSPPASTRAGSREGWCAVLMAARSCAIAVLIVRVDGLRPRARLLGHGVHVVCVHPCASRRSSVSGRWSWAKRGHE